MNKKKTHSFEFKLSCGKEMVGKCDSPIRIAVPAPKLVEGGYRYDVQVIYKGWWLSNVLVNGELIEPTSTTPTHKDFRLEYEQFTIERICENKLTIMLNKQAAGEKIKLNIRIQSGNCFNGFTVEQ
jgi:hypothetical protein